VEAVLRRPHRGARAARAVPEPVHQAGRLRLHGGRELLLALAPRAVAHGVAAHVVAEAEEPVVAELLLLERVGVDRVAVPVERHGRARAEAGLQAAAREEVHRGEVLGEAERVLGADGRDGRAEVDAARALRGRGHHGDGGGDPVLEVAVPEPRAVEAELLAALDDAERGLVAGRGIRRVEGADGEEAEARQRGTGCGHATRLGARARSALRGSGRRSRSCAGPPDPRAPAPRRPAGTSRRPARRGTRRARPRRARPRATAAPRRRAGSGRASGG
jgi:hypothetical protein